MDVFGAKSGKSLQKGLCVCFQVVDGYRLANVVCEWEDVKSETEASNNYRPFLFNLQTRSGGTSLGGFFARDCRPVDR